MAHKCGEEQPHNFHHFEQDVRLHCSGTTDCNVVLHEAHFFNKTMRLWCPGICDCKDPHRGTHGPGDHK